MGRSKMDQKLAEDVKKCMHHLVEMIWRQQNTGDIARATLKHWDCC